MTEYTLRQSADLSTEERRLALLQGYQDPPTIRHLTSAGVAEGWRCLEVGGGAGSIARWLAGRVGTGGSVVATDLETGLLGRVEAPNLTVERHDVRTDPLPEAAFDLVHTRLVLIHLPEREEVLAKLARAVRPGGILMVGDVDATQVRLLHRGEPDPAYERMTEAYDRAITNGGWDRDMGPKIPAMLERHGLLDVVAECFQTRQPGGGPASSIWILTLRRLRDLMLAEGLDPADFDRATALLADPAAAFYSPVMWTAWGRKAS